MARGSEKIWKAVTRSKEAADRNGGRSRVVGDSHSQEHTKILLDNIECCELLGERSEF